MTSTDSLVSLSGSEGGTQMTKCAFTAQNFHFANAAAALANIVFFGTTSTMRDWSISMHNIIIDGPLDAFLTQTRFANVVSFLSTTCDNCFVSIVGVTFAATIASANVVVTNGLEATNLTLLVSNITFAGGNCSCIVLQSSTVNEGLFHVSSSALSTASPTSVLQGLGVLSSSVSFLTIVVHNVSIDGAAIGAYLLVVNTAGNVDRSSTLTNVSATMTNCSTEGSGGAVFYVNGTLLQTFTLMATDVSVASSFVGIYLLSVLPGSHTLMIALSNSVVSGSYPFMVLMSDIFAAQIVIINTTLLVSASKPSSSPSNVFPAFGLVTTTLRSSSVLLSDVTTVPCAVPSGYFSSSIMLLSSVLRDGTNLTMLLTSVLGSGSIILMDGSTISDESEVLLGVGDDVTIEQSSKNPVSLTNVIISNGSTVTLRLPNLIPGISVAGAYSAFYIVNVNVFNSSSFTILGNAVFASTIRWPYTVFYMELCNISLSSSFLLSGLDFETTSLVALAVCVFFKCSISENSFAQLSYLSAAFTALSSIVAQGGVGFNTVTIATGSFVSLTQVTCSTNTIPVLCVSMQSVLVISNSTVTATTSVGALAISTSQWINSVLKLLLLSGTMNLSIRYSTMFWSFPLASMQTPIVQLQNVTSSLSSVGERITIALVNVTVVAPWTESPFHRVVFLLLVGPPSTASTSMNLTADQMLFVGRLSLIERSQTATNVRVGSVALSCSWWGRHMFTNDLTSLTLALQGTLLRGPFSAITSDTNVVSTPNSSSSAQTTALCIQRDIEPRLAASWSATSTPISTVTQRRQTASSQLLRFSSSLSTTVSSTASTASSLDSKSQSITLLGTLSTLEDHTLTVALQATTASIRSSFTVSQDLLPTATITSLAVTHSETKGVVHSSTLTEPPPQIIVTSPPLDDAATVIQFAPFVSALSALSGGGSIGDAGTLAALTMMTCGGQTSWDSNTGPQRYLISVFYDLGPGAALFGNVGIVIVFFLCMRFALCILQRSRESRDECFESKIRYPNTAWSGFMLLLPGMLFSATFLFSDNGSKPPAGWDERVLGSSPNVRITVAAVGLLTILSFTVGCVATVLRGEVLRCARCASTSAIFCEPFLPRWFLQLAGSWLLPTVIWEPNELKMRYGDLYSSVAWRNAFWAQNVLQAHGAVFALIAAIPFSEYLCFLQFTFAMMWMCVPIGLVLMWKLRLLRRPPTNHLLVLSSLLSIGVLAATLVLMEAGSSPAATTARDVFSILLSVVSLIKTLVTIVSAVAEWIAKRRAIEQCNKHKAEQLLKSLYTPTATTRSTALSLTDNARDNEGLHEMLLVHDEQKGHERGHSNNNKVLDALIARIVSGEALAQDYGMLSVEQYGRLRQYTLKLLVTRAARNRRGGARRSTFASMIL
ncbi:transmembrane protein, putative [Bodo saltans]|uniref:Transmembrane protein, putative n=1 Tax=Bodo saltans TaxID=75058 RepID=A0A0S4JJ42_BODSA|nr:transmembrane protein, putative [Bodo saltans]|eukprot:CUG90559.1 transmembrane protein, putative [Bodo saltans]